MLPSRRSPLTATTGGSHEHDRDPQGHRRQHRDHVGQIEMQRPPHNYFDNALINQIADAWRRSTGIPRAAPSSSAPRASHSAPAADFANRPSTERRRGRGGKHL